MKQKEMEGIRMAIRSNSWAVLSMQEEPKDLKKKKKKKHLQQATTVFSRNSLPGGTLLLDPISIPLLVNLTWSLLVE